MTDARSSVWDEFSDNELRAWREGDPETTRKIWEKISPVERQKAIDVAKRYSSNYHIYLPQDEAEFIGDEAVEKAVFGYPKRWRDNPNWQHSPAGFFAYERTVVENEVKDWDSKRRREPPLEPGHVGHTEDDEETSGEAQVAEHVPASDRPLDEQVIEQIDLKNLDRRLEALKRECTRRKKHALAEWAADLCEAWRKYKSFDYEIYEMMVQLYDEKYSEQLPRNTHDGNNKALRTIVSEMDQ